MITHSSYSPCGRLALVLVCSLASISTGCGYYRNQKRADNIVAIGWEPDGRPVSLGQEVTYKSGFVGVSPDTVDPTYDLGPLVVLHPRGRRTVVPGFESWWRIGWALARAQGKGFVLTLTKGGPDNRQSVCLLIDSAAHPAPCPVTVDPDSEYAYLVANSDQLVFWKSSRRADARAVNLQTGDAVAAETLWAQAARGDDKGSDWSFSALAPGGRTWAVAFPGRGRRGIWLMEEGSEPELLVAFAPDTLPPFPKWGAEDTVRLFSQTYGLAWAPDASRIYWCGEGTEALVVGVGDGSSRPVTPCLTGATWSPDGRRVAGVDERGLFREWVVQ